MLKVNYGAKNEPGFELEKSDDLIAVRTRSRRPVRSVGPVASPMAAAVDDGELVAAFPEAGVEVFRVAPRAKGRSLDERKVALRASPDVQFAGGVLVDPGSTEPVLYTENLFIKFKDGVDSDDCREVIQSAGLVVKKELDYATNAWFVGAPEGTGTKVFDIAQELLKRPDVEYCHPELIRPRARKAIFSQQWHLKPTTIGGAAVAAHANVEAAHELTRGEGITVAVIDDGVDIDHPEFSTPGKVVATRDITEAVNDPRPKEAFDKHGTACAGVACADGKIGASGVAPAAKLMPIRLASGLGSQQEADAFKWAADHGADVISCSWGPEDGKWFSPNDPLHNRVVQLPTSTRLAIDYAVTNGRGGKGCVVLFAAGNGNEKVDNDGYASYEKVTAVAACNDRSKRSVYSDFGKAIWCAFPSSDFGFQPENRPEPLTPGIWTTDRRGTSGYNTGDIQAGDAAGDFTNDFGGTSSSCPGAAGVAALILSVNPALKWNEVKETLRKACDKIDPQGGNYDTNGRSPSYGFGRLNARTAVELAKPQLQSSLTVSRVFDAPIPDLQTVSFALDVMESASIASLAVSVDLRHSYIGDLVLTLIPPPTLTGAAKVVLHKRTGGRLTSLTRTWDATTASGLSAFAGKSCKGKWTLQIQDAAARDDGSLKTFALTLSFPHPNGRAASNLAATNGRHVNGAASRAPRKAARAPRKKLAKARS